MQDSNIVSQVVKIESTDRKTATHFALCNGSRLRYLIDLDGGAKRLSKNISTYSKRLRLLMQFINVIPFSLLNWMKLGYFVKAELNKEVETCRKNTQKKHWNMESMRYWDIKYADKRSNHWSVWKIAEQEYLI